MEPTKYNLKSEEKIEALSLFLKSQGLMLENIPEYTVVCTENGKIIGTASYDDDLVKYFAVDSEYRGTDLSGKLLTEIKKYAFEKGMDTLFLLTSPANRLLFEGLLFSEIESTEHSVFMECPENIDAYFRKIRNPKAHGVIGSIVMNCDPFTKGHRYLIETAAGECDFVYVFVLSEDKSFFSAKKRFEAVKAGTEDIPNVAVVPTEKYLISSATFPTYFIRDKIGVDDVFCELDVKTFGEHFVPNLNITRRYLGSEPFCPITNKYNETLKENLPEYNCEVRIIERLKENGEAISAGKVCRLVREGKIDEARALLPETTAKIMFDTEE